MAMTNGGSTSSWWRLPPSRVVVPRACSPLLLNNVHIPLSQGNLKLLEGHTRWGPAHTRKHLAHHSLPRPQCRRQEEV